MARIATTRIASDLASRALAAQAKPPGEPESPEVEKSCPPAPPKLRRIKSNPKVTQKCDFQGFPQSKPKVTPKVTFCSEKVTFELLLGSKSYFPDFLLGYFGGDPESHSRVTFNSSGFREF